MLSGLVLVWLLSVRFSEHDDILNTEFSTASHWNPNPSPHTHVASFLYIQEKYHQFRLLILERKEHFVCLTITGLSAHL